MKMKRQKLKSIKLQAARQKDKCKQKDQNERIKAAAATREIHGIGNKAFPFRNNVFLYQIIAILCFYITMRLSVHYSC